MPQVEEDLLPFCSILPAQMLGFFKEVSSISFQRDGWQRAIIPGTVLNSLVANKVFPEPYFGLNNMSVGWDFTFSDGIRDRNTGIWRPIEVYATNGVDIRHIFVKTDLALPDTTKSYQTDLEA